MEGVKEKAEGAEGVSEGGLDAKEKPEDAEPKGVDPPREKAGAAALVVGTEKLNDDEEDDDDTCPTPGGTMLNGAADAEAVGAGAAAAKPNFGNDAGAGAMEAELLVGCVAKEPANREKNRLLCDVRHRNYD